MTLIHLDIETVRAELTSLRISVVALESEIKAFRRCLVSLESSWQGGGRRNRYLADATNLLSRLRNHEEMVNALITRAEREVIEWERQDKLGSDALKMLRLEFMRADSLAMLASRMTVPLAAGIGGFSFFQVLPLFMKISIGELSEQLPAWSRQILERLFPSKGIISPLAEDAGNRQIPAPSREETEKTSSPDTGAEATINHPTPEDPIDAKSGYDIYHPVPTRSQGNLYGSAACAPTAASMVLDYYHNKDTANSAASPDTLIGMLDKGDGTPGQGISLSNMNDEFKELGYKNINVTVPASMEDLRTELQDGPAIVTAGVNLVGPGTVKADVPRAITGAGNTMHAMVVTGIGKDGSILVNDPWTGQELSFRGDVFEKMWNNGKNGMYAIHP